MVRVRVRARVRVRVRVTVFSSLALFNALRAPL